MSFVRRNIRRLLALMLLLAAVILYMFSYLPARRAFEAEYERLSEESAILQVAVLENLRYAALRPELEEAARALHESRSALYSRFPAALREEDQILYIVYLEERFGTEIRFDFGAAEPITELSDGAVLGGVTLTVNYAARYQDFKAMLSALAADERITSIRSATMDYDAKSDTLTGELTILRYVLEDGRTYTPPVVEQKAVGKSSLFR